MNFKLIIKNLFARKDWTIHQHAYGDIPGVKSGRLECRGNFFQMIIAMFLNEIHYPKI